MQNNLPDPPQIPDPEIEEAAPEPAPMIDIHDAHHAASSWKEFFIHIATICLGLLIAIGLEQTVVAIDHARERRDLIANMRTESERNVSILQKSVAMQLDQADWLLAAMKMIEQAKPNAGVITVTLPAQALPRGRQNPDNAVWTIAQTSGKTVLLSETEAEVYYRLELEVRLEEEARQRGAVKASAVGDEEVRLHIHLNPGTTVALPVADRPDLLKVLAGEVSQMDESAARDAIWEGAADGVAHGVKRRDELFPYINKARTPMQDRLDKQ
jgi:hypothetical protein